MNPFSIIVRSYGIQNLVMYVILLSKISVVVILKLFFSIGRFLYILCKGPIAK